MPAGVARRLLEAGDLALDSLAAALLAPPCAVCTRIALRLADGAVCAACWRSAALLTPPLCARCGAAISPGRAEALPHVRLPGRAEALPHECPCGDLPDSVDAARALGPYEGVLRSIVHALKYDRRRSVAPRLARLAAEHCASILGGADALVPVPLHWRRRWTRGFNQAEEIARHLPLPVWCVLRRVRHTPPQAGLAGGARARNVAAAFAPRRLLRRRVEGAALVLLDDVSTTGATLGACAAVLREMGAREVRALTIARTMRAIDRAA